MFRFTKQLFAGLGAVALLSACTIPAPPPRAVANPTVAAVEPMAAVESPTEAPAVVATEPAMTSLVVNPFDVSVAQMFMDTAGFHGMAETLSDTRKIDTAYLSTVNRVTKVLTQTVWPAEMNDEVQAFIGTLGTFAAALTAGDVEAAVEASDVVHDAAA